MSLFLGVDGGQTSTVALIADDTGKVLGAGRGGPCNHVRGDEARARFIQAISECLSAACQEARLDPSHIQFEAACLGFSGGVGGKDGYSREVIRSRAFKITHDAQIALTGATAGDPGIIVIAGTGSIAFGENSQGKTGRAGGWGYIFGDEGGAFDIVRQALRAALAAEEGWGPPTALRDALLQHTGEASADGLTHSWYSRFNRQYIAGLAPLVDQAARDGDALARDILIRAAHHLCDLTSHVHGILFQPAETIPIAYIGGVFECRFLTNALLQSISHTLGCNAAPPLFPPAAGALISALRMAGNQAELSQIPVIKS